MPPLHFRSAECRLHPSTVTGLKQPCSKHPKAFSDTVVCCGLRKGSREEKGDISRSKLKQN